MCMSATCQTCSGASWVGCGAHIPRVMDNVPESKWCTCPKPEGSKYPPGSVRPPRTPEQRAKDEEEARMKKEEEKGVERELEVTKEI